MVTACSSPVPMTLTKILAWRRSPLTSTCVMLANPTRGSFTRVRSKSLSSAAISSPSFSCRCGFGMDLFPNSFISGSVNDPENHVSQLGDRKGLPDNSLALVFLCTTLDTLLGIRFDSIAHFKIREIIEQDTTFIATGNLAHIISTPAQRGDFAIIDHLSSALNAGL